MNRLSVKALFVATLLVSASGLAVAMKPTKRLSVVLQGQKFEQMIPQSFGSWEIDRTIAPLAVAPDVQEKLDLYYDQTLSRTYVDKTTGERVMLSIAYGGEQSRTLQVHRPEVCYVAQGFRVGDLRKDELLLDGSKHVPVMRLVGQLGQRNEPITYWVRFGHDVIRGNVEQGLSRLRHGLKGEIPDGLLFRVSSFSGDYDTAYRTQDRFSRDLLNGVSANVRSILIADS